MSICRLSGKRKLATHVEDYSTKGLALLMVSARGVHFMAKMYPEAFPDSADEEPGKVSAEKKVYSALAKLPDDYIVFYNKGWLRREAAVSTGQPDFIDHGSPVSYPLGEIDFVVLDPDFGCFVIEVKGGGIELEGGTWLSIDRKGRWHHINDPILQARKNMYALIGIIKEIPQFRNRFFYSGYGVILTDVSSPHRDFGIGAPIQLFGFAGDLDDPRQYFSRLRSQWLGLWHSRSPGRGKKSAASKLSARDCALIVQALVPSMILKKPPLGVNIRESKEQIIKLTREQFKLLQYLSQTKKALVSGGAGTGKTMLALEKARLLALQGFETLFTCPNKLLADALAFQAEGVDNLTVLNFHQLCYRWGHQTGLSDLVDPDGPNRENMPRKYFDETLPDALLRALDLTSTRFDAVIVDEGQDMNAEWWDILKLCMEDFDAGVFYIFYDQHQTIWQMDSRLPLEVEAVTLVENLRNSKAIHSLLSKFYNSSCYRGCGPEGGNIEYLALDTAEPGTLKRELCNLLYHLIEKEKVKPCDIAILTGTSKGNSALAGSSMIGRYPLVDRCLDREEQIFFSSIRRFRGMERPVVILIELEELLYPEKMQKALGERLQCNPEDIPDIARETLYIGLSRAQSHLYIIGAPQTIKSIQEEA